MATTLDEYRPYDAGAGANVTESGWRSLMAVLMADGPLYGLLNQFSVYGDSTGRQTKVRTGHCWIRGHQGASTSEKTLAHSTNGSGNPRIDRVVLRNDFVNNRIELDVLTGTPAASPSAPSLTQSSSVWEISLAKVAIANGYSTIAAGDVTDERVLRTVPGTRIGATLRREATQAISGATVTAISWDTEDQDTDAFATGSTFTVPGGLGGLYMGYGFLQWTALGTDLQEAWWSINDSTNRPSGTSLAQTAMGGGYALHIVDTFGNDAGCTLPFTAALNAGDVVRLMCYDQSANTIVRAKAALYRIAY